MGRRNEREDMVVAALAAVGFDRNARSVPGAVRGYEDTYGLGFVSAGNGEGRSTTLIDAFRSVRTGGMIRLDMLSVKGSAVETVNGDPKLPAYANLLTGNRATVAPVVAAVQAGAPLPVLHFASLPGEDGPEREGWFLAYDAAPFIRAMGELVRPNPPGHRWGRGNMPAFSVGMTPGVKSGGKYVKHTPGWTDEWTYAIDATHVSYPRMQVGYLGAGLSRRWERCNIDDLPGIVEGFDWRVGDGVSVYA